ncbi:hypothetical protein NPX79_01300 [Spiroplasma endosymbiont of Anurida maritima]|uniref:hypothetical protein n=1 Tax=Spiroplasma endosymbiont of Anurida maritima TaxID=2967972 RepID=UPI0036D23FD3
MNNNIQVWFKKNWVAFLFMLTTLALMVATIVLAIFMTNQIKENNASVNNDNVRLIFIDDKKEIVNDRVVDTTSFTLHELLISNEYENNVKMGKNEYGNPIISDAYNIAKNSETKINFSVKSYTNSYCVANDGTCGLYIDSLFLQDDDIYIVEAVAV